MRVNRPRPSIILALPHADQDIVTREHMISVAQQEAQQLQFSVGQVDSMAIDGYIYSEKIRAQVTAVVRLEQVALARLSLNIDEIPNSRDDLSEIRSRKKTVNMSKPIAWRFISARPRGKKQQRQSRSSLSTSKELAQLQTAYVSEFELHHGHIRGLIRTAVQSVQGTDWTLNIQVVAVVQ